MRLILNVEKHMRILEQNQIFTYIMFLLQNLLCKNVFSIVFKKLCFCNLWHSHYDCAFCFQYKKEEGNNDF